MGEKINIVKIGVYKGDYVIDIQYEVSGKGGRIFVMKDELFAMLAVAEKDAFDSGSLKKA